MINRAVLWYPELIGPRFDFFNDAGDTVNWLRGLRTEHASEVASRLEKARDEWLSSTRHGATTEHTKEK